MILFSDNFNFSKNNFKSLYDYLDKKNIRYEYDEYNTQLKKSWFNRNGYHLIKCNSNVEYSYNIQEIINDELLTFAANNKEWLESGVFDIDGTISLFSESEPDVLRQLREVAFFWIEHWQKKLSNKYDAVIVFGGNTIYNRALFEVAKEKAIPVFVTEHFFSGHDFYLEQRYSSIPNQSKLKVNNYIEKKSKDNDYSFYEKIRKSKNKNVVQPSYRSYSKNGYILILGQVNSDFSIIGSNNKHINSILLYKNLIEKLISTTDKEIVFKPHPYEEKKSYCGSALTSNEVSRYIRDLDLTDRVCIVDGMYSVQSLVENCEHAVVINSQSGIEVSLEGKPCVTLGNAFYARKGFTFDYDSLDDYISDINNIDFTMEHESYLNKFLSASFSHLVGIDEQDKVEDILLGGALSKKYRNKTQPPIKAKAQPPAKKAVSKIKIPSPENCENNNSLSYAVFTRTKDIVPKKIRNKLPYNIRSKVLKWF